MRSRPLDRIAATRSFRLLSALFERGGIIFTSNSLVSVGHGSVAGDEILTTAILARLLQHVTVEHIDAQRRRLRELDALLMAPPPFSTPGGPSPTN